MSKALKIESKTLLVINKFLQVVIENTTSLQAVHESFLINFQENFSYEYCCLALFNEEMVLEVKTNFNKIIRDESISIDIQKLKDEFSDSRVKIVNEKTTIKRYREFFHLPEKIWSLIIQPLKYNKNILGFFLIGKQNKRNFVDEEISAIKILTNLIEENYVKNLLIKNYETQTEELRSIIKQLRHDFANDIQSIALSLELLESTEISEEQKKFIKILFKAKESAIEKLTKLKFMKEQHEKKIQIDRGFTSN